MKPITARDLDILAKTIDGEAEGETDLAKTGVAYCIIKRANLAAAYMRTHNGLPHALYGDGSIATACMVWNIDRHTSGKVWQFSCWTDGSKDRLRIDGKTLDDPQFQKCFAVAIDAALGRVSDPTSGATHYWDDSISAPSWALGKLPLSIGHLKFIDLN